MTKSVHKCKQTGGSHCGGHLGYRTKSIFQIGLEFDISNPYMKSGSNRVIND